MSNININDLKKISEHMSTQDNVEGKVSIGVDVDGTLTNERLGEEIMILTPEQIKKRYAKCTLKKGAEILFDHDADIFAITGRREIYRDVTVDWFDEIGVTCSELVMVPNNFYYGTGYIISKYVEFKIKEHLQRNIKYSFDDNMYVVNALNQNGINAFKVDKDFGDAYKKMINLYFYNKLVKQKKIC